MSGFRWRSLRSDVRRHFAFLYARQYLQVRAERDGVLSGSGCIVLHRDGIWVMASRHMDEDFIDLSFVESAKPLDWFDMADVVGALGIDIYARGAQIAHVFQVKAPILERFLPMIEEAVGTDRKTFLCRVDAARHTAVRENASDVRKTDVRRSTAS